MSKLLTQTAFDRSWQNCHKWCSDERRGRRGGRQVQSRMKRATRRAEKREWMKEESGR